MRTDAATTKDAHRISFRGAKNIKIAASDYANFFSIQVTLALTRCAPRQPFPLTALRALALRFLYGCGLWIEAWCARFINRSPPITSVFCSTSSAAACTAALGFTYFPMAGL